MGLHSDMFVITIIRMVKKIAIGILVAIIVIAVVLFFIIDANTSKHTPYALRVDLVQNDEGDLAVNDVSFIEKYAPDYKHNLLRDYYQFAIIDRNDNELFEGKVRSKHFLYIDTTDGAFVIPQDTDELSIVVPYFSQAEEIRFVDQSGKPKITVNLNDYDLRPPRVEGTLCGNKVCDITENILACYRDCKHGIDRTFGR